MKTISQILNFLEVKSQLGTYVEIETIFLDSRKCDIKSAFIALKGETTDGNNYIDSVIQKGVKLVLSDNKKFVVDSLESLELSAIIIYVENLKSKLPKLAQWFYGYKKPQNIIGVTGTNGKTSISYYITQFLTLAKHKAMILGTNGNGIYPNLQQSSHTTLDTLSLYEIISDKTKNIYDDLVMEVSSHSLAQNRVEGLNFDIAVFSNLTHDHLDYHKNMENYFLAKAKLFKLSSLKKAVINIDDKWGQRLCKESQVAVTTVSLVSKESDIYIHILSVQDMQTRFCLYIKGQCVGKFKTHLVGEFNLTNLALSIGALDGILSREILLKKIVDIHAVKGRMELIELPNKAKIVIDYAHTPDALEKALQSLRESTQANLCCLFGCGGNRDNKKRAKMAKIAEKYSDKVVVTEDNNRFEDVDNIFADISKGFAKLESHTFIKSREVAIKYCIQNSKPNDVILLAGKGHECYIDKNGVKEYFDERDVIRSYNLN